MAQWGASATKPESWALPQWTAGCRGCGLPSAAAVVASLLSLCAQLSRLGLFRRLRELGLGVGVWFLFVWWIWFCFQWFQCFYSVGLEAPLPSCLCPQGRGCGCPAMLSLLFFYKTRSH